MSSDAGASGSALPDPHLVTRLLREQVPTLAGLPVRHSPTTGSSNWVFRLGEEWAVRLPRSDDHVAALDTEVRWLPHLGPQVSAPMPELVATGEPSALFPRRWAVVSWIPGDNPLALDGPGQSRLAWTLGDFVQSLHAVDSAGLSPGVESWGYRCGEPVTATIDAWAEHAADVLGDLFDPARVRQAWSRLRNVPAATAPPCWVHTDLSEENLVVAPDGALAGVIDFGGLGIGDRSVDLLYAWSMFDLPAREAFRAAAGVDDATWIRARAWAFVGPGLLTIAHYRATMTARTARLTAMVERVAAEVGVQLR